MKSWCLVFVCLSILLLSACTPQPPAAVGEEGGAAPARETGTQPSQVQERAAQYDSVVATLREKGLGVTNYKYSFSVRKRNLNGNYVDGAGFDVYIKDSYVRKVYSSPIKLSGDQYYNEVFLDTTGGTAVGRCTSTSVLCLPHLKDEFTLSFSEQRLDVTPQELLRNLDKGAKVIREQQFDNRKAAMIEVRGGAKLERLFVDIYYGIPLQWEEYILENDEEVLQTRYSFSRMAAGNIKLSEVLPPS